MRAFEELQLDTKELDDIPALLPAIQAKRCPALSTWPGMLPRGSPITFQDRLVSEPRLARARTLTEASTPRDRRPVAWWLVAAGVVAVAGLVAAVAFLAGWFSSPPENVPAGPSGPPIRIGVLHSHTGTMALSERPVRSPCPS